MVADHQGRRNRGGVSQSADTASVANITFCNPISSRMSLVGLVGADIVSYSIFLASPRIFGSADEPKRDLLSLERRQSITVDQCDLSARMVIYPVDATCRDEVALATVKNDRFGNDRRLETVGYWHVRSQEARSRAEHMINPESRQLMSGLGDDYERAAHLVEGMASIRDALTSVTKSVDALISQ
jgi:hypothetical protein